MAMNKKRGKISAKLKSRILSESFLPGSIISNLAKSYGISANTIYNWRRGCKKAGRGEPGSEAGTRAATVAATLTSAVSRACVAATGTPPTSASCVNNGIKVMQFCPESKKGAAFVELPIRDSEVYTLQKVSLIFEGLALTLEGGVKSSSLFAIVKIRLCRIYKTTTVLYLQSDRI